MIKILHGRNYGHLRRQFPEYSFKFHFIPGAKSTRKEAVSFIAEMARVISSYSHPPTWTIVLPKYELNIGNPKWLDNLIAFEKRHLVCAKKGRILTGSERWKHFRSFAEDSLKIEFQGETDEDVETCVDDAFAIRTEHLREICESPGFRQNRALEILLDEALYDESKTYLSSLIYYSSRDTSEISDFETLRRKAASFQKTDEFDTSQKPNCLVRKKLLEFFPTKSGDLPAIYKDNTSQPRELILRYPAKSCKRTTKLMILVKTAPVARQKLIRDFYRQQFTSLLPAGYYELVFVIGGEGLVDSSGLLKSEIKINDDFLIALFRDTYESLPRKTFAALQYLSDFCAQKYDHLLFIDDDTLIDVARIFRYLEMTPSKSASIRCLPGNFLALDAAPYSGKYFLFPEMWPVEYAPPKYCNGQCSLWSAAAVERIFKQALQTDRHEFRLEDFYFGGILRQKAGVEDITGLKFSNKEGVAAGLCRHMPKSGLAEFVRKNFEAENEEMQKQKIKNFTFSEHTFIDAF